MPLLTLLPLPQSGTACRKMFFNISGAVQEVAEDGTVISDLVSEQGNKITAVRPSVRLFTLSFESTDL